MYVTTVINSLDILDKTIIVLQGEHDPHTRTQRE